jgi:exodeoxyribonuclease I
MVNSFYFYDVETSGFNPRQARVMQFAGQRTDMNLKPVGDPDIFYIKITPDILPDPDAVLVTGITPQKTLTDGITEAEFLKYFHSKISLPGTISLGFNSVRFDDEFIRFLNYRNFYDPYEWQWQDDRSRWDLLDVLRMARALRPDGIVWPYDSEGKAVNKLSFLAEVNKLKHEHAHDAASDVVATIAVTKLLKDKQPKLFDYLLKMRDKKQVEQLVTKNEPFLYSSGRYAGEYEKTTVAVMVCAHPSQKGSVFVYDLRNDPSEYGKLSSAQIAEQLVFKRGEDKPKPPFKQLQFNRCPAVAPMSVLDSTSAKRLSINLDQIHKNFETLLAISDLPDKLTEALKILEKQKQTELVVDINDVDAQLYDGFFSDDDKDKIEIVQKADENTLADLHPIFNDARLDKLLLLYKARQFPKSLSEDEQKAWESYRQQKLLGPDQAGSRLAKYFARIEELDTAELTEEKRYLLEELKLYGESLVPYEA